MRCSKCGNDNREGRKFCTSCGTPLVATCPKCSAPVQPGERFCGECGAAIGASAPRYPSSAYPSTLQLNNAIPATEVIDGERKTVTALFADIKGSMELMEDLDPEEARAIVDPALKLMIGAVRRYDGYIVQSTGDGIFALFGAPVAHEDHPQRALYAALRIQDQIAPLRRQLARGRPRALTDPHRCQYRRGSGALYSPRRGQERVHADRPYSQSRSADAGAGESRLDSKSYEALI
jgi:hypothetical protein